MDTAKAYADLYDGDRLGRHALRIPVCPVCSKQHHLLIKPISEGGRCGEFEYELQPPPCSRFFYSSGCVPEMYLPDTLSLQVATREQVQALDRIQRRAPWLVLGPDFQIISRHVEPWCARMAFEKAYARLGWADICNKRLIDLHDLESAWNSPLLELAG